MDEADEIDMHFDKCHMYDSPHSHLQVTLVVCMPQGCCFMGLTFDLVVCYCAIEVMIMNMNPMS